MCYEAGTEVEVLTGGKWWSATVIGHIHGNAYGLKVGDDHLVATLDRMRTPERLDRTVEHEAIYRRPIWLASVVTDEGVEIQSVHESREEARLHTPRGGRSLELTSNACARLAAEHGVIVLEDGSDDLDAQEVTANTILPNVWDNEG